MVNFDVSVKNVMYVKEIIFGIFLHVVAKMEKKLASIVDDSAITCDEVTESYDEEAKFNKNKAICKTPNYYI